MRTSFITIAAIGALLIPAGSAMAQSTPSSQGYGSTPVPIPQSQVLGEVGSVSEEKAPAPAPKQETAPVAEAAQPTPAVEQSSNTLPFTGMDIGIVAALGIALLFAGVMMRRSTRTDRA